MQTFPPAPPAPPGTPDGRRPLSWWLFAPVVAVFLAGVLSAALVPLPYYALAPGEARSVDGLVEVEGTTSYPSEGELLLTTVSLRRVTAAEALFGWLDPSVDVFPEEQILGPVPPSRFRQFNLQLMDTSKQTAVLVALEKLGYDVPVHGEGAVVLEIVEGSAAEGLLEPGDVIVGVDGNPVELSSDATEQIGSHGPGEEVTLEVRRGGSDGPPETITAVLSTHPDDPAKGLLGVTTQTFNVRFDFPFEVEITSDRIGGPSAGLAFTLEVLDMLTPDELTGGAKVAVTGEILPDGRVGTVGGVAQKAVAVERAGADVFLVPAGEEDRARERVGDSLRIEPVEHLDDALRILDSLGGNALALGTPGSSGDGT